MRRQSVDHYDRLQSSENGALSKSKSTPNYSYFTTEIPQTLFHHSQSTPQYSPETIQSFTAKEYVAFFINSLNPNNLRLMDCLSFFLFTNIFSMHVDPLVDEILPHRIKNQAAEIPDEREILEIWLGWNCYRCSEKATSDEEEYAWWLLGEAFSDYLCIDRLNNIDRERIDQAAQHHEIIDDDFLGPILDRAERAADLHLTLGYGLLAETAYCIGQYYRQMAEHQSNEISYCYEVDARTFAKENIADSPLTIFERYLNLAAFYYAEALKYITAAQIMAPATENIINNAIWGDYDIFSDRSCSWNQQHFVNQDFISGLNHLSQIYTDAIYSTRQSERVASAIVEGENLANHFLLENETAGADEGSSTEEEELATGSITIFNAGGS